MQHVVVVDDEEISLRFLRNAIADLVDVVVHPFSSSSDALSWCEGNDVDCFIIDYHLPAPDGIETTRRLRAMPRFREVPIVILTGEHEREIRYQAFDAGATDFVQKPFDRRELRARLTTMLALRAAQGRLALQIGWLEASFIESEERARRHADRLEALWRVANNPEISDAEMVAAMLHSAANSIRRDQPFVAVLGRVEGDDMVTEALSGNATGDVEMALRVGTRRPLAQTIAPDSIRRGRTQSWDDLTADPFAPADPYGFGWRAVLTTRFNVGADTYALLFASTERAHSAFRAPDHRYAEVLAQFFATHLQQRWQAAQIRHQLEHDSLTGLWNRSRFRSLGRAALRAERPAAVVVLDLTDFHAINESHGHLTGDAVLIEAAAALSREATGDEIVARVGGDSFAICFPAIVSPAALRSRIARLAAVFDTPLRTGVRSGQEVVPASASVGIAIGPGDGSTIDDLLLRAEARTRAGGPRSAD